MNQFSPPTADLWNRAGEREGGPGIWDFPPPCASASRVRTEDRPVPTLTPISPNEMRTAWPRRLKPLLDVLEELGCEPRAVLSEQVIPDAPIGNLNLSTIVGRSTADMKPFLNKLSAAIHRRPNDNDLWRDVCGPLRFVKVSQGLVVVFERAIGTLRPTLH